MLKTLGAQVKEFKKASIATPLFMILEVIMEMVIPLMMASIIDDGVEKGNLHHIYVVGAFMVAAAAIGLFAGIMQKRLPDLQEICVRPCLKTFRNIHFRISTNSAPQVLSPA